MAIRTVVTRGYGNGTFNGTIPLVVTRGYTSEILTGNPDNFSLVSYHDRRSTVGFRDRRSIVPYRDRRNVI